MRVLWMTSCMILGISGVVLVLLKLTGSIDIPWAYVLAPIWVPQVIFSGYLIWKVSQLDK